MSRFPPDALLLESRVVPGLSYVQLSKCSRRSRKRMLRQFRSEIFVHSFPESELPGFAYFRDAIVKGRSRADGMMGIETGGDVVIGTLSEFDEETAILMGGYIAARPDRRNLGIASELMAELMGVALEMYQPSLMLGEVEDPAIMPATEFGDPLARIRLYDRMEFPLVRMPYVMPTIPPAERQAGTLLVTTFAGSAVVHADDGTRWVPADLLDRFLQGYYRSCEGDDYEDDPRVAAMFRFLRERELVELVPLSEWESCPRITGDGGEP